MNSITVTAEAQYSITFPKSWRDELERSINSQDFVVVTTAALVETLKIDKALPDANFFLLPEGEEAKTFSQLERGLQYLGQSSVGRGGSIIAIGGGSVTDYSGFLASIWLRGISWIAIPTTLAGMVDAAIGGKTGINSVYGKNLIGSFHSPKKTIINFDFLSSLDDRDLSAGLAEVIKTGFIGDPEILAILGREGKEDLFRGSSSHILQELIWRSASVKAGIVSKDFKEGGVREFLNYGHTLGHAIEKHSQYNLRHGEAVAIGLVFAAALGVEMGLLDPAVALLHSQLLVKFGLPIRYPGIDFQQLLPSLFRDKKFRDNRPRFVLLEAIAAPIIVEDISLEQLKLLYERVIQ